MNRIRRAAGEKNASAINYHFGSEKGLLLAVLSRYRDSIVTERIQRLSKIDGSSRKDALTGLAEALVLPFARQLTTKEKPKYYVQLVAQWYQSPVWRYAKEMRGWSDKSMRDAEQLAVQILDDIPSWIVLERMYLLIGLGINLLADWERVEALKPVPKSHLPKEIVIELLIDSHISLLAAEPTKRLLASKS